MYFLSLFFFCQVLFSTTKTFAYVKTFKYKVSVCSMAGRQVFEVPPANIGGSPYCLAVGVRGIDLKKVR